MTVIILATVTGLAIVAAIYLTMRARALGQSYYDVTGRGLTGFDPRLASGTQIFGAILQAVVSAVTAVARGS